MEREREGGGLALASRYRAPQTSRRLWVNTGRARCAFVGVNPCFHGAVREAGVARHASASVTRAAREADRGLTSVGVY